jgi:molybdopterin-binding protein
MPNWQLSAPTHPERMLHLRTAVPRESERYRVPLHLSRFTWTCTGSADIIQPMKLSARNRLVGKVEEVKLGNVMAHVVVRVGENIIESVITRRSAEEMGLNVGDTVAAIIKSTEVMLQKD